ncbi:MAG: hypothetical protein LWX09_08995 [Bacteroidia bacterium]|nr:hypothetical protein [Bacteroidia bacterium]
MTFNEINELRKAGKLEVALEMARQALAHEPDNIWNKRAAAWVHYEYLKGNVRSENYDQFRDHLIELRELKLPQEEFMVFDNTAWKVGLLVKELLKAETPDFGKVSEIFDLIKDFHFTKPSEAYSFLYKAFHKGHDQWSRYLEFADWWDFSHFRSVDYLPEKYDGRTIMAIAEQAYIAYAKKLLEGEPEDLEEVKKREGELVKVLMKLNLDLEPLRKKIVNREKVRAFLPRLEALMEKHPEYVYPPYYRAKLMLASGSGENPLQVFLPFARQKKNEFWVWQVMAEIFHDNSDMQLACYCKALSLNAPGEYLTKLKLKLAALLEERGLYDEAKTEIEEIVAIRAGKGWKPDSTTTAFMQKEWYAKAQARKNNRELYAAHSAKADEILFRDIPEEVVVVEFVNEDKQMLNFVRDQEKQGFFKYAGLLAKPKIGDLLWVRFDGGSRDGFYRIFSARKADKGTTSPAIRHFEAKLKVGQGKNFGFAGDVFVEPKMLSAGSLFDGLQVRGRAILSFNKSKGNWAWKAIEISPA